MTRSEYKALCQQDKKAYGHLTWGEIMFHPGIKLTMAYRRAKYYSSHPYLRPLGLLFRAHYHQLCVKYGYDVPSGACIDGGLRVFHPNGIVINSGTRIGKNFTISGGGKIGIKRSGEYPVIGDNVTVGINSTIIGSVHIGDGAIIGAGSVVVKDVPSYAVVCGNPASVIKMREEIK